MSESTANAPDPEILARITEVLESIHEFWSATEDSVVAEEIVARDRLGRLASCSIQEMILLFRHYRLFTMRHIDDLAIVVSRLPFSPFKAFLGSVLNAEFGMGTRDGFANNHVALLDAFLVSLGARKEFCQDPDFELPANLALLDGLSRQVQRESLAYSIGLRGMGAECLCQVYLTAIFELSEKNPAFIERRPSLDLRFDAFHRGPVAVEHRIQIRDCIAELVLREPNSLEQLKAGYERARQSFDEFFENIYRHIDGIVPGQPVETRPPTMQVQSQREGETLSVRVAGRVDGASAPTFEEELERAVGDEDTFVLLDLEELSYISSAGLRVVLLTAKKIWKRGGRLVLCSLQPSVQEVMETTNFHRIFSICDSRAQALDTLLN